MTTSVQLPRDDTDASLMRFDGVRGHRYTEIFLIDVDQDTGRPVAAIYNTTGLNGEDATGDSSPQALLDRVNLETQKAQYGVAGAYRNGPRLWCLDWLEVRAGTQRDFAGLAARWVMWLDMPKEFGRLESLAYKPITGRRDTSFGINAGSPAFVLDDPDGDTWVMKSVSLIEHPDQTYEGLTGLADRLALPSGWRFRAVTLERDLVLTPDNGHARITQDDLGNVYDRAGGPYSNYRP